MPIRVLTEQLASQIAAGEVVERPASAVKELIENSLDAGATSIAVTLREGGQQLIQVADDGMGIAADEVEIAFLRHATSKLVHIDGLNRIETLGFRGEALAAIAAVSKVTVVTKTAEATAGTRLVLHGGHVVARETVGAPQGTLIAVEDLFYNTPARRRFLKTTATERRYVDEIVTHYALAYPQVRFRLTHDGRETLRTDGTGRPRDSLIAAYGVETAREFLAVDTGGGAGDREERIVVQGFVSPPSLHRANRSHITLFVNGRRIKDSRLTYAVIQAYHTLLPTGRFPLAVLFIAVPPETVDVNVHPMKSEVRFRDQGRVFGAIQRAVRDTLVGGAPVRPFSQFGTPGVAGWEGRAPSAARAGTDFLDDAWPDPPQLALPEARRGATVETWQSEAGIDPDAVRLPIMRVVGQIGASYIITEGPDGMYLIDQHAAHERILYEKFMAEKDDDNVASQGLIAGAAVHLTPAQGTLLEENLSLFDGLGFAIEPFGPGSFMIRAVPALLARQDPAAALVEALDEIAQEKAPLADLIEARIVKRVCKTAAVKAGQTLSRAEMEQLILQLEACESPHTCPHGRPTYLHLSVAHLAREFGRI